MKNIIKTLTLAAGISLAATNLGAQPALKDVFKNDFIIGAALNPSHFCETNAREAALVKQHFNAITSENALKWESVHPAPGRYDFTLADRYVAFGEKNGMFIVGHTLVWHNQTPDWVFKDDQGKLATRELLLQRMRDHIIAVVGRYKGRIKGWDVVNEAVEESGTLRQSQWMKIIGEDYLLKAYQFAHEADPRAELYYNDYWLERPLKGKGALALIKKLQSQGAKIHAVGLQGHYSLDFPDIAQLDRTISEFAKLGVKVNITELDVDVLPWVPPDPQVASVFMIFKSSAQLDPYTNGLPDSVQQELAQRYSKLFSTFLRHRNEIERVSFWGVTDAGSWLNSWPIQGRTNYPLLFDRQGRPKPAFDSVIQLPTR
jgi:endo-1,4-beta-xylanase